MEFVNNTIETFIDRLKSTTDQEGLRDIFDVSTREMGFRSFSYHMIKVVGVGINLPIAVTTYPDQWVERYIRKDYTALDPVISMGPKKLLPFSWGEEFNPIRLEDTKQKNFFSEAYDFNLRNGLSIPIHGHAGEFAQLTLVADGPQKEADETIAEHRFAAHLMAMYYHQAAGGMLIEQANKTIKAPLTPRERDVLRWAAKGKTAWEIASILAIGETTVVYHIENAKKKLGASSRAEAVVKAIYKGLIEAQ